MYPFLKLKWKLLILYFGVSYTYFVFSLFKLYFKKDIYENEYMKKNPKYYNLILRTDCVSKPTACSYSGPFPMELEASESQVVI